MKAFSSSARSRRHRNAQPAEQNHQIDSRESFFSASGERASAGLQRKPFFQPKLTIGQPGDRYEREADAVADAVVSQSAGAGKGISDGGGGAVQRMPITPISSGGLQRAATPDEEKMPGTNDQRMAEDKAIQEKPVQKAAAPEEEEPVQAMEAPGAKEEEKPAQKAAAPEEEEPVQAMEAPGAKEEEKPVQKAAAPEEEEPVQAMEAPGAKEEEKPVQKAPAEEKEQPMQAKSEEEEPVQGKEEEEQPVQAKAQPGPSNPSPAFAAKLSAAKNGGSSLPKSVRSDMEQGIGADFSGVRVHTGGEAAELNKDIRAQAFTHGRDVFFAPGKFSPEQTEGRRLLAHELTHVVQQSPQSGSPEIQKKDDKAVSSTAMTRIRLAQNAIRHTKQVFSFGAGNQKSALRATNFNSYYRMKVMRSEDEKGNPKQYWQMTDAVKPIAAANPEAEVAAKADIAQGGNCGEHARVAFDFLRVNAVGETITRVWHVMDHAFVLIGLPGAEPDSEVVVSDPWPTAPTATVWEDHFGYGPIPDKVKVRSQVQADGQNVKAVIAAGLTLNDEGKAILQKTVPQADVENKISNTGHLWEQPNTAAKGKDFNYTSQWDKVAFQRGTAKLTKTSEMILDLMAADLGNYPQTSMTIEGHTDDRGSDELNQKLSEDRAQACYDGLVKRGIPAARLSFAGFGETRPIADNKTAKGREQNRRVDFILRTS